MAWTAPKTWVANAILTAAELNVHLRDNLSETAPAKVSVPGQIIVSTAANAITARTPATDADTAINTYTSTSYGATSTAGPAVTVTTGASAYVSMVARIAHNTAGEQGFVDFQISGATSRLPSDQTSLRFQAASAGQGARMGISRLVTGLTPGNNTFTLRYRTTAATATFAERVLTVIPL